MLADTVPLYPLYALLFADTGLSSAEISALFVVWSAAGIAAELPSGALADRFSRRGALALGGVLQGAGYALWIALPGFPAFAGGFALWGIGGALVSGAQEALLYDGLAALGAQNRYLRVQGRVNAAELVGPIPAALAATLLFDLGGYPAVGWVSVGCCVAAAAVATRLPEPPRFEPPRTGYLGTLRTGIVEVTRNRPVRLAALTVALLSGLDAIEEYFTLLAAGWGVATELVPVATLGIPLTGAAGAAMAGLAERARPAVLALLFGLGLACFTAGAALGSPAGLVGVATFYALYRLVLVVVNARLQERIEGHARATVTSVAGLGEELVCLAVFGAWALGGLALVLGLSALLATGLPRALRPGSRPGRSRRGSRRPRAPRPGSWTGS